MDLIIARIYRQDSTIFRSICDSDKLHWLSENELQCERHDKWYFLVAVAAIAALFVVGMEGGHDVC